MLSFSLVKFVLLQESLGSVYAKCVHWRTCRLNVELTCRIVQAHITVLNPNTVNCMTSTRPGVKNSFSGTCTKTCPCLGTTMSGSLNAHGQSVSYSIGITHVYMTLHELSFNISNKINNWYITQPFPKQNSWWRCKLEWQRAKYTL